jgi:hypothetical protein
MFSNAFALLMTGQGRFNSDQNISLSTNLKARISVEQKSVVVRLMIIKT